MSWQIYLSHGITKLRITQFSYGYPKEVVETVTWNVEENSTVWVDMTCMGDTSFEFLDSAGNVKGIETRGQSESYLGGGTCQPGKTIKPSDYNEEKNQYASDTFGGTKPKLNNPPTADGSGGKGETGYKGIDDGTNNGGDNGGTDPGGNDGSDGGDNGGGDDSGGDGSDGSCEACKVLECPGWDEYMDKIDDIAGKIPPPPNWDEVAGKFRDTIVPKVIDDLGDLLGRAPAKPTPPPIPDGIDDRGFKNSEPKGQEAPGLGDTDFSKIKDQAPVIKENEDNSDGFNILNPVENLPSQDEFKQNLPNEIDNPTPDPPKENNGNAPMPNDNIGNAPVPEDSSGTAPIPNDSGGRAPIPGESGGNAPLPGNNGGTAPIPGNNGGTAPIPGNNGGTPPIPGNNGGNAPVPGGNNDSFPMPKIGG